MSMVIKNNVHEQPYAAHVWPLGDTRTHITEGMCWCRPRTDKYNVTYHNWHNDRVRAEVIEATQPRGDAP